MFTVGEEDQGVTMGYSLACVGIETTNQARLPATVQAEPLYDPGMAKLKE